MEDKVALLKCLQSAFSDITISYFAFFQGSMPNEPSYRIGCLELRSSLKKPPSTDRARKIFEFHLAQWASNFKLCLPGALPRLPKFSISLIIHDSKMEVENNRHVLRQ